MARRLAGILAVLVVLFTIAHVLMARREPLPRAAEPWAPDTTFLETRSGRVHLLDRGKGPTLMLLHGTARSVADWLEGSAERFARNHRVVAIDYYGNGLSDRDHGLRYGTVLWAQQVVDVMDALGIERAAMIGHSVGGVVAALVGAEHPTRVSHVVTIGTGMAMDPAQIPLCVPVVGELLLGTTRLFGPTHSARHHERILEGFRIAGTRAALLTYVRRQYTIDGVQLLFGVFEDIRAPMLHVSGADDRLISTETSERLAERTGGAFVRVDGIGHDVHIEAPEQLVLVVEGFIATAPAS